LGWWDKKIILKGGEILCESEITIIKEMIQIVKIPIIKGKINADYYNSLLNGYVRIIIIK
jgi:hypothetical protein